MFAGRFCRRLPEEENLLHYVIIANLPGIIRSMQTGQFITARLMPKMIREICEERSISFTSFSDDWLLHLERNGKSARVLGYKFSLNDSVASSVAQDKVAAYELFKYHNIPAVPHYLIRTKANEMDWHNLPWGKGMVIKPLSGTSGHGVAQCFSASEAGAWMEKWGIEAWAVSPFVEIRREVRLVLLDNELLLAYEKQPVEIDELKFFNLGKGATAVECQVSYAEIALAQKAKEALGLRLCTVDTIELNDGSWQVLEVNDGIMMENYARQSLENKKAAKQLYQVIIAALFS